MYASHPYGEIMLSCMHTAIVYIYMSIRHDGGGRAEGRQCTHHTIASSRQRLRIPLQSIGLAIHDSSIAVFDLDLFGCISGDDRIAPPPLPYLPILHSSAPPSKNSSRCAPNRVRPAARAPVGERAELCVGPRRSLIERTWARYAFLSKICSD